MIFGCSRHYHTSKMRKKVCLCLILLITFENIQGEDTNKSRNNEKFLKNIESRSKRSYNAKSYDPVWMKDNVAMPSTNYDEVGDSDSSLAPFWGTRGRRNNFMSDFSSDRESSYVVGKPKFYKDCHVCPKPINNNFKDLMLKLGKDRRDESVTPFWGHRGRRNSEEDVTLHSYITADSLDSSKDRDIDTLWGTRGRRLEDSPFWGARGRRQNSLSIDNQARQTDGPFWGNRGRRDDSDPFWGMRGRREESAPFWGNRGRRQENDPFWGARGKKKNVQLSIGHQAELKDILINAIHTVENDIESLSRLKRNTYDPPIVWNNERRESQLKSLFNGANNKYHIPKVIGRSNGLSVTSKPTESSTILDNRIYAEQPSYIIVERSSRSSSEDDPFFISRGKKKFYGYDLLQAARNRRGSIEELVKSVRNDPYYIVRGKKSNETIINTLNDTSEDLTKVKDLICSAIDLITVKNEYTKVKREVNDSDRDRRTILKKLAAQLQIDPYFVSRGKKNEGPETNIDKLEDFIREVAFRCG